ncbi:hypothetical protein CRG98_038158 [Punica granatum]|uniref:Uncharacterized protein n=1 Tax=Punica granatum TaxID=22663 RepID=A0A2I0IBT5_PUNGR|nr:hypothetical protein CRG98_038158 [Punica granatum]
MHIRGRMGMGARGRSAGTRERVPRASGGRTVVWRAGVHTDGCMACERARRWASGSWTGVWHAAVRAGALLYA